MKTLVELRKEAGLCGIKNYSKFSKEELEVLINNTKTIVVEIEPEEVLTEDEVKMIEEAESNPNLNYSDDVVEEPKKGGRKVKMDVPDFGTQSRKIYDYIADHLYDKNFTVYRVCQFLNTPSNNTRRIYFKFFSQKREEFLLQNRLEEMESRIEEPILVIQ